jgi:PAS domain S-box-containing protein
MLGYESADALLAEPAGIATRLYVDTGRRTEYVRHVVARGSISGFESALRRRDSQIIWVSQSARLVRDTTGEPKYLEGFVVDITARKAAEQLKADFVSFVTHQLRTPLAGIRWMIELARDEQLPPEAASYLADAHGSAQRLIALVNDLLDITRFEAGRVPLNLEAFDLRQMATEIAAELAPLVAARQQSLRVTGQLRRLVYADPQLTRQAIMNLVSNATKYTPTGGDILVTTHDDGNRVVCAVHDTGIGVPPAAQARLFQKFFRADNAMSIDTEGTGLGLYLVKLIAERSGGTIACESMENQGSTFILTLPAAAEDGEKAIA